MIITVSLIYAFCRSLQLQHTQSLLFFILSLLALASHTRLTQQIAKFAAGPRQHPDSCFRVPWDSVTMFYCLGSSRTRLLVLII
jgi:hypothetical protein